MIGKGIAYFVIDHWMKFLFFCPPLRYAVVTEISITNGVSGVYLFPFFFLLQGIDSKILRLSKLAGIDV